MRYPPTHLSIPLSILSLPPFLLLLVTAASHSPLRLSLFNLTKSSPSAAQLYSTGIEMGLSLPASSRNGGKCQSYHARPPTDLGLTIGRCAVPAVRLHLLVLVVLVAVEDGVFLHQRKSAPTLLVQVWVGWLWSLHHVDVRLTTFDRHVPLLVSVDKIVKMLINLCHCLSNLQSLQIWNNDYRSSFTHSFKNGTGYRSHFKSIELWVNLSERRAFLWFTWGCRARRAEGGCRGPWERSCSS